LVLIKTPKYYLLRGESKIYTLEPNKPFTFHDVINVNTADLFYFSRTWDVRQAYINDIASYHTKNTYDIRDNQDVTHNFTFLRQSTITSFFISNMVDMPICFKKSKSLYSKTFELPLFKFINLIMRNGLRERALKAVTLGFNKCFLSTTPTSHEDLFNWTYLYHFFLHTSVASAATWASFKNHEELDLENKHQLIQHGYDYDYRSNLKETLFERLEPFSPVFAFYIKKVSKTLRKNSRGKSGKYMLTWKYVPIYKRLYITMRWFLKDLRFQKSKDFHTRLLRIIEDFLITPDLSFVSKVRRFTHKFVFAKHRHTLLKTLKSV